MTENQWTVISFCLPMITVGVWLVAFKLDDILRKLDAASKEGK
jgi:hypothetical protein